jgi:hypothetical protein
MMFTGGDASLLSEIIKFVENIDSGDGVWKDKQASALGFLEPALEAYFTKLEYNPFEGANP